MKIINETKRGFRGKELLVLMAFGAVAATSAWADWDPGDPYKMHFPQLPDPNGWDVNFTQPITVADDWQCSETGPVTDVHFWFSVRQDEGYPVPPSITSVYLAIYKDVPDSDGSGPLFSHPGELIDDWTLTPSDFSIRLYNPGNPAAQGWYDPSTATVVPPVDHINIWQMNISSLSTPITQTKDTIYWLGLSLTPAPVPGIEIGWKTSLDHWNDDAVWGLVSTGPWNELKDPLDTEPPIQSLDMAFVVTTPEPQTYGLVFGAVLTGFAVWRNWRKHDWMER